MSRPAFASDENDPAKRFGEVFVANDGCAGQAAADPALPEGGSCYQAKSPHDAFVVVSAIAKQSGTRVSLQWSDAGSTGDQLRAAALGKADTIALAVIGKL